MNPRRACPAFLTLVAAVAVVAPSTYGQDLPPTLDPAVAKGLAFLASQQNPDGSFTRDGPRAAVTGLALMAFLAAGHVPEVGRYGLQVTKATDFLLASVPADDGYIGKTDGSRMYGHGIVTLALAEVAGVEDDPPRKARITAAVARTTKLLLAAQQVAKPEVMAGGWRYDPTAADSDLSLSGWCAMALRAARDIGEPVPREAVDRAAGFVVRCWRADQSGFGYQPGAEATTGLTGVGVLALAVLGGAGRPELAIAAKHLIEKPVTEQTRFPYYSTYYVTQAAHQLGDAVWAKVWPGTVKRLLESQQADGGWPQSTSGEEPGRVYATAMAVLSLSVPYRVLPIYQR